MELSLKVAETDPDINTLIQATTTLSYSKATATLQGLQEVADKTATTLHGK